VAGAAPSEAGAKKGRAEEGGNAEAEDNVLKTSH
jgi:hypothetical protein